MKQLRAVWQAIPSEQKAKIIGGAASFFAILAMFFGCLLDAHWRDRMIADFWPLDNARIAPNILASLVQTMIVASFLYVVWPRFRAFVKGSVTKITTEHSRHTNEQTEILMRHHENHVNLLRQKIEENHAEIHAKIDGIATKSKTAKKAT